MLLSSLGWDASFASSFADHLRAGLQPARVSADLGPLVRLLGEDGERLGEIAGRLRHAARSRADWPVVGDWVAAQLRPDRRALVHAVLPRRTRLARKLAGATTEEQVLAANVHTAFLVCGLDHDWNPRRLERALLSTFEGGADPVVVLNKADRCARPEDVARETLAVAQGVPVIVVSATTGAGVDGLERWLLPGQAVVLLGSSGVGKSTLANRLLGVERQATGAVRAHDDRGRHTTSRRELIQLPGGAWLIDTPGLRELGLWAGEGGLRSAFGELDQLARACRFSDCAHAHEPGCAVRAAVAAGRLQAERLASYHKLEAERRAFEARRVGAARAEQRRRWKLIGKAARRHRPRE